MPTVTQRQIARQLAISRQAVGFALSANPADQKQLGAETRRRIIEAAERLGYVPHQAARSLRLGKTYTIVLTTTERLHHPYMHELLEEIHAELSQHDYHLSLELLHRVRHPEDVYRTFVAGRYDGVIAFYAAPADLERMGRIRQSGMPVVLIGPAESSQVDIVDYDRAEAVRLGVAHLLAQGHTRIALVYDAVEHSVRQSRLKGYQLALQSAGVPFDAGLLFPWRTDDDPAVLWEKLAARQPRPTAVFSYNGEVAVDLSQIIRAAGEHVPADVAIVAQGNTRLTRRADVALTAVDTDVSGIAVTAVEMLMEQIKNPSAAPRRVLKQPFLVVRSSTDETIARGRERLEGKS